MDHHEVRGRRKCRSEDAVSLTDGCVKGVRSLPESSPLIDSQDILN